MDAGKLCGIRLNACPTKTTPGPAIVGQAVSPACSLASEYDIGHPRLTSLFQNICILCSALFPTMGADFTSARPILERSCMPCHSTEKAAGGLRLDRRANALKVLTPGQPDQSVLLLTVERDPGKPGAMPPGGMQLSVDDRAILRSWIAEGAPWPESIVVGQKVKRLPDDATLVDKLHQRIVAASKEKKSADMQPLKTLIPGTDVFFEMLPIPGGEFQMGSTNSKIESPQHKVKIDPFWMGKFEVTWDEYRLFMFPDQARETKGADPNVDAVSRPTKPYVEMSFGMGLNGYPAISMTQHAANKYAEWLSAKTGHFYRLPTEAEWEYACRAGTSTAFSFGDDASKSSEYAWSSANANGKYEKVGTKKPNPWGLFDMHGNVMEWTLDAYAPYVAGNVSNPWVKSKESYPHAVRGGSWNDPPSKLSCGSRVGSDSSWKMQDPQLPKSIWYLTDAQWLGFRLVRPLHVPSAREMFQYWNNGVEVDSN